MVDLIRRATPKDVNAIIQTLKDFHSEMEFDFAKDVPRVHSVLVGSLNKPNWVCFISGDPIKGVFLAYADDSAFGPVRFASEKIFWVDKEHRKNGVALALIEAFESWARELGCNKATITAQANKRLGLMARLLHRIGYYEREVIFCKDLG